MTYKSKRIITSMGTGILLVTAYIVYALGSNAPEPDNLKSWAIAMLIFVGISVAVLILIQILFNIAVSVGIAVKEQRMCDKDVEAEVERIISSSMVEDEMDKLINLKSAHIGYICIGFGFIAALLTLAFGALPIFMMHVLFGSVFIGTIAEGIASVYGYERGVRNG